MAPFLLARSNKMKVVQVNSVCGNGSTGRICLGIKEVFYNKQLGENKIIYFWGKECSEGIKCSNIVIQKCEALKSRVTGKYGFTSKINSRRVIELLEKENPDIVHLHNIHDHTVDIYPLLDYLGTKGIKTVWTMHDCWAFTAYCAHYQNPKCDKWINGCSSCPVYRNYSWFWDKSDILYKMKRDLTAKLDLHIVVPSKWLESQVKSSFLNRFPVSIISNGINLNVFKPCSSNIKSKYDISNKYIVLGCAYKWNNKKGLDIFINLSKVLGENYIIILLGTDSEVDRILPSNIISVHRTRNQSELAEFYSVADVFVNPTREDTFPTVNMEALACGTPVITFNTGGSSEIIDPKSGFSVDQNDEVSLRYLIVKVCEEGIINSSDCISRSQEFNYINRFHDYLSLYECLLDSETKSESITKL